MRSWSEIEDVTVVEGRYGVTRYGLSFYGGRDRSWSEVSR